MARKPARTSLTDEGRESRLVSAALDLAERQILEGTASSQVITHFLKLGSSRERLEQDRLREENQLLQTKVEALQSTQRSEELYKAALEAMRAYSGTAPPAGSEDDYEDLY
jgi:hypothetical protein